MAESHREEIAKLEALYASNPGGRVFVHLAEAYRKAGELELARGILSDGLGRHTDSASGYVVLGRVLSDMGDAPEAQRAFRRVLELDAGNLIALRGLGDLALDEGRTGDALELYRELLSRNPSNEEVRTLVADVERRAAGESAEPDSAQADDELPADERAEAEGREQGEAAADAPSEMAATAGQPDEAQPDEARTDEAWSDEAWSDEARTDQARTDEAWSDDARTDDARTDETRIDEPRIDEESGSGWTWAAADEGTGSAVEDLEESPQAPGFEEPASGSGAQPAFDPLGDAIAPFSAAPGDTTDAAPAETVFLASGPAEADAGAITPDAADADFHAEDLLDGSVDGWSLQESGADPLGVETFDAGEGLIDLTALEQVGGMSPRLGEDLPAPDEFEAALAGDETETGGLSLLDMSGSSAEEDTADEAELPAWSGEEFPPLSLADGSEEPSEEDWHAPLAGADDAALAEESDGSGTFSFLEGDEPAGGDETSAPAEVEGRGAGSEPAWDVEGAEAPADSPFLFADEPSEMGEVAAGAGLDPGDSTAGSVAADNAEPDRSEPHERGLETETMADLYRAQGFLDRAADVYRALLRRRPGDERLTAKLQELEEQMAPPQRGRDAAVEEDDAGEVWLRGVGSAWAGEGAGGAGRAGDSPYVWAEPALAEADEGDEAGEPIGSYLAALASWAPAAATPAGEAPTDEISAAAADEADAHEGPWAELELEPPGSGADADPEGSAADAAGPTSEQERSAADAADPTQEPEGAEQAAAEPWGLGDVDYGYEPWAESSAGGTGEAEQAPAEDAGAEPAGADAATDPGGQGAAVPLQGGRRDAVEAAFDEWYGADEVKQAPPPAGEESEDDEDLAMFRSWLQSLKK
jgi:tetratricopeptide (TPR) repeat protein